MEVRDKVEASTLYDVVCLDRDGNEKWRESIKNLVVNEGLDYLLTAGFKSGGIASWYVGLKGTGAPAAGDTLVSHAGWAEVNPYSGNRPAFTPGTVSGQSLSNSASRASFSITGPATVAGAFLASANTGTTGTLYGAANFSTARSVESGDTMLVTATLTTAAA